MSTTRMFPASATPRRRARAVTAGILLAAAGLATPALAQNKDWTVLNGQWSTAGHWSPFGVPGPGDVARIGSIGGVENALVTLTGNVSISGLQISDGMQILNPGWPVYVANDTQITGWNFTDQGASAHSTLRIANSAQALDFSTRHMQVLEGGRVYSTDHPLAVISGMLTIDGDSQWMGNGVVQLTSDGALALRNDGTIRAAWGPLTINQLGSAGIDLDGQAGDGRLIMLETAENDVTINGAALTDPFSGTMYINSGSSLSMNLADGWAADSSSTITSAGDNGLGSPSRITGGDLTFGGTMIVYTAAGPHTLLVTADTDLTDTASVTVQPGGRLEFEGATTVLGGQFTIEQAGRIEFNGETTVRGGTFTTNSDQPGDGVVWFAGETEWNGIVTIDGAAMPLGAGTVTGSTVIHADMLDMDSAPSWAVNHSLVINAGSIEAAPGDTFDGVMSVAAGWLPRIFVNLADPAAEWTMAGELNIAGDPSLFIVRVGGSPVRITGDLNVSGVRSQFNAPTTFAAGSATTLALPTTVLRMNSVSQVDASAAFLGSGMLQNGPAGTMNLGHAASLALVGLTNENVLTIAGDSAGVVTVDRFTNGSNAAWRVDVGGDPADSDHDLMVVTGQANLAGSIEVGVIGPTAPQVGDTYTVLTTGGGVSGTFAADPVSFVGPLTYEWEVIYNPGDVRLRVERIVRTPTPCPADWNQDGVIDSNDISALLTTWLASVSTGTLDADVNSDGAVNSNDISAFLHYWLHAVANGCD